MKIFSQYTLIARALPTIIGLLPLYVLQYVYLGDLIHFNSLMLRILGDISLSSVIFYTFNQYFIRIPSKVFEDILFKKQLYFPTTNLLMYSDNEYSDELKNAVRKSVYQNFDIKMPGKNYEKKDEISARKRVRDVIRLMIGKVKDGYLVLQHNIEYGFVRNMWGASITGIFGSLLLMGASTQGSILAIAGKTLLCIYITYLLIAPKIVRYFGQAYAKKLIEEYYEIISK